MTPGPWAMALLALAAFRVWKVAADDAILDGPRDRLLAGRPKLDEFVSCPWCLGFWIGGLWWAAWWYWPETTLAVAAPFALSALVGAIRYYTHDD